MRCHRIYKITCEKRYLSQRIFRHRGIILITEQQRFTAEKTTRDHIFQLHNFRYEEIKIWKN